MRIITLSEAALKKADKDAEELVPTWHCQVCKSCGEINPQFRAGFRIGKKQIAKQDFEKFMAEELKKLVKIHPSSKECYESTYET